MQFSRQVMTIGIIKHWAFKNRKFLFNPHGGAGVTINTITPESKNAVDCIVCQTCNLIYIGETGNTLISSLKQHLYNIGQDKHNTPLLTHFPVHSPQHLSISGLHTCASWTVSQRRRNKGALDPQAENWGCRRPQPPLKIGTKYAFIPLPPKYWKE